MAHLSSNEFCLTLKDGDRLLALDVGSKTIGLASAVWGQDIVVPMKTLFRQKFTLDANELLKIIKAHEGAGLVIGWPLLQDGTPGKRCQSVKDFAAELGRFLGGQEYDILMTFWDERFSTQKGDQVIEDIGKTAGKRIRSARRDQIIDSLAAQHILQDFMDTHMTTSSMY
jgi:putative Holliday junction resolvase